MSFRMAPIRESPVLQLYRQIVRPLISPRKSIAEIRHNELLSLRGRLSRYVQTINWEVTSLKEAEDYIFDIAEAGLKNIFGYGSVGIYLYNITRNLLLDRKRLGLASKEGIYTGEGKRPEGDDKADLILKINKILEGLPESLIINPKYENIFKGETWYCLDISNREALGLPNFEGDVKYYKGTKRHVLEEIFYYFLQKPQRNSINEVEMPIIMVSNWANNRRIYPGIPPETPVEMKQIGDFISELMFTLEQVRNSYMKFESNKRNSVTQHQIISSIPERSPLPVGKIWETIKEEGGASKYLMNVVPLEKGRMAFYLLSVSAVEYAADVASICLEGHLGSLVESNNIPEILAKWSKNKKLASNVRLFLGIIDEEKGELKYGTHGNFPYGNVLYIPKDGKCEYLFNIASPVDGSSGDERLLKLNPGDILFVYGSGIPLTAGFSKESRNVEDFGRERIIELIDAIPIRDKTPEKLANLVFQALKDYGGGMPQSYSKAGLFIGIPEVFKKTWRIINAEKMLAGESVDWRARLERLGIEIKYISPDEKLGDRAANQIMEAMEKALSGDLSPAKFSQKINEIIDEIKKMVISESIPPESIMDHLHKVALYRLSREVSARLELQEISKVICESFSEGECNGIRDHITNFPFELAGIIYDGILQDKPFEIILAKLTELREGFDERINFITTKPFNGQPNGRQRALETIKARLEKLKTLDLKSKLEDAYNLAKEFYQSTQKNSREIALSVLDKNREDVKSLLDRIFHLEIKDEIFKQMVLFGYTQPVEWSEFAIFGKRQDEIWHALIQIGIINEDGIIQPKFNGSMEVLDFGNWGIQLSKQEKQQILNILNNHISAVHNMKNAFGEAIINTLIYGVPSENSYIKCEIGETGEEVVCDDGEVIPKGTERVTIEIYNEVPLGGYEIKDKKKRESIERPEAERGRGLGITKLYTSKDTSIEEGLAPDGRSKYYRTILIKYKNPNLRRVTEEEQKEFMQRSLAAALGAEGLSLQELEQLAAESKKSKPKDEQ